MQPESNSGFYMLITGLGRRIAILILFLAGSWAANAQNIDSAFKYYNAGKFDKAALEFEKILPYLQKIYGITDTSYYTYYLFYTADCFKKNGEYTRAENYFLRAKDIYEIKNATTGENYLIAVNKLAESYNLDGKIAEAEKYYLQALDLSKSRYGETSPKYASVMGNLAVLYHKSGNYRKAEPLFIRCLEICRSAGGADDQQTVSVINNLGAFYDDSGDYIRAEKYFLMAFSIREKIPGPDSSDYAVSANNLAELYFRTGRYEESEKLYLKTLAITKKTFGEESPSVATALNNLGALYQSTGNNEKAETCYIKALEIRKKTFGTWHPVYATSLNNMALFYHEAGNYEKAEPLYLQALDVRKAALGEDHPDYGVVLNNLALFYSDTGNNDKAEAMLEQSLEICRKSFGEEHVNYAVSLNNLALFFSNRGDYAKAGELLKQVLEIYRKSVGEGHPAYAQAMNNLAEVYDATHRDREAEELYLASLEILKKAYGENHPDYSSTLCNLALFYQVRGNASKAAAAYRQADSSYLMQIRLQFRFLSEGEKEKYLNRVNYFFRTFQSFIFGEAGLNPSLAGDAYNIELSVKGLLLNSDKQIRMSILGSGDTSAVRKYDYWLGIRAQLAHEYALPLSQQRPGLKQVESEANDLEKQLIRLYSQRNTTEGLQNFNWQEVQKHLKRGEAAIEFSSFPYFNGYKWSDSTIYAAIVLRKGDMYPQMVTLCEGKSLDSLLTRQGRPEEEFVNDLYNWQKHTGTEYEKSVKNLYNLLWKPLEKNLNGIKTIYFSASGRLHQVSFSAIASDDHNRLSDRFRLIQLSSTSRLALKQQKSRVRDIVLYGGIDYDAEIRKNENSGPRIKPVIGNSPQAVSVTSIPGGNRGASLEYLGGSLTEVKKIAELASAKHISSKIYTGAEALEQSVRSLSGNNSPAVLHISTHGFFYPDAAKTYNSLALQRARESSSRVFRVSANPLMRSGLAFAGANHLWQGEKVAAGIDDGILTAYEVSNMYLPHTELVVLSACETGLGEIKGSEGVFGLQRAFRIAGAENIIMSLWQIPDYQTSELMEIFYREWFGGKLVNEAFRLALNSMKAKYPNEPYLWGAFVLIK